MRNELSYFSISAGRKAKMENDEEDPWAKIQLFLN